MKSKGFWPQLSINSNEYTMIHIKNTWYEAAINAILALTHFATNRPHKRISESRTLALQL